MSRWVIAIALSWSAWVVTQPAVVHARSELAPAMCAAGSQTVWWEDLLLGRALPVSAAEDNAAPMLLRTAAVQDTHETDDAPIAWCISPDDPRCAPRDQSAPLDGPRGHVPMQDVTAMRWPELAADSGKRNLSPQQLGAPRAGVGLRLERPPRG
ncbi:MAG TPA: hypothetical protein VMF89_02460 [Polyangiales bacterium]|nr:hypothetical protein [Polyangiales bacterium]